MLLAVAAVGLFAQSDRGVITGSVTDSSSSAVPNAQVTAIHVATNTNYKTNTTSSGDFTVPSLPVGIYQIRIENAGFKTHVRGDILLAAGSTVRVDAQLELGATQQTVEVTATAQLLEAETSRVASQVPNALVDGLPVVVNGGVRSPFDLAAVAAEVSATGFRIGGGSGTWGMTLDGNAITGTMNGSDQAATTFNTPSVEALTEFSVEAGGFKAETGHASGGTASFVSKSGTNEFHGSAYEFMRNEALDARGFFAAKKAVYKQHDFGFSAGGPVVIPKLYDGHNRTFFFVTYEGFRNRAGAAPTPYSVPPPEFFTGDLRNWVDQNGKQYQVYDPASQRLAGGSYVRDPFPNNQIPQSRIDPVAKPILQYAAGVLKANVAAAPGTSAYVRNNYLSNGTTVAPNNKYSVKVDQTLSVKHHASFFFNRTRQQDLYGPNGAPGLPKPLAGNPGYNRSDVYRGSWDYTISPTWLNRFYGGFNNWRQNHASYATVEGTPMSEGLSTTPASEGWKAKGICIPNYPDCNANFPIIGFNSEFTNWGQGTANGSDRLVFEVRDDMTKITGKHTFKGGYYYNDSHYNGFGLQNYAGNTGYSRLGTSVPLATNQATGGGSAFAAFLLGYVNNYSLDTPRYIATQYRTHQMYFQDDWKVSQRLTLNLGLRYEMNLAPVVGQDQLSDLDVTLANPAAGGIKGALIFAGDGKGRQGRRSLVDRWSGWGPRLGFSYALNNKTSIRGAATRSFGAVVGSGSSTHNLGFITRLSSSDTSQGLSPLWLLKDGAPAWPQGAQIDPSVGNGANVAYYNGNTAVRGGGELTYTLNVQRQLTGSTVVEIGYLGTLGSNLPSSLLALNSLLYKSLPANLSPFTASGRTLLNSLVGSAAANAAGIVAPWSGFNALWGTAATVAQAVRPFPQYGTVDTAAGGGDRLGHSTYHSMMLKFNKRYSAGLTIQASYVLSKSLTDSDASPFDVYNLKLLKSIASYDQTHSVKLTYVYELPFGPGKRFLNNKGVASQVLGGWRVSGINAYSSGLPVYLETTVSFPLFNTAGSSLNIALPTGVSLTNATNRITASTYDGWRGTTAKSAFDPNVDKFLQPASFFGTQPTDAFGNTTRYNPKLRFFPNFNENISLARSVQLKEKLRLEFRGESFNVLNRTQFGPLAGALTLQNPNFGLWKSQANTQRRIQLALKLYW